MTADQRLDQLEPLISESITVLDRHTAQLTRLSSGVSRLIEITTQQSENVSFLLEENTKVQNKLTQLDQHVAELRADVAEVKADVAELKQGQRSLDSKLDLILSKMG